MAVKLEDLKPGSVVVDMRGSLGIVTELRPSSPVYPVIFAVKASGTCYKAKPDQFRAVLGQVDLEAFKGLQEAASKPLFESRGYQAPGPGAFKDLKQGDKIMVKHGFKTVEAVYEGYHWNRPMYPLSYSLNGKKWKGPEAALVGKAA